jgi:hypothetical protein
LATLIIVAVVIIMAALTVEVKASPVFDRANLKEECHILLEEARWNRYSKARRCGSEWSGIQEAAVDPVYFSRAPWAVTTVWLSTASIWGEERFPQERTRGYRSDVANRLETQMKNRPSPAIADGTDV